jgi:hypothetical protein
MDKDDFIEKIARIASKALALEPSMPFTLVGQYVSEVAHEFNLTTDEQKKLMQCIVTFTMKTKPKKGA